MASAVCFLDLASLGDPEPYWLFPPPALAVFVDLHLSRRDPAEMTGTTLFTVSRFLSDWEAQGFVEGARGRVTIPKPHALVSIAEDLPLRDPLRNASRTRTVHRTVPIGSGS